MNCDKYKSRILIRNCLYNVHLLADLGGLGYFVAMLCDECKAKIKEIEDAPEPPTLLSSVGHNVTIDYKAARRYIYREEEK